MVESGTEKSAEEMYLEIVHQGLREMGWVLNDLADEQIDEYEDILLSRRDFILGISLGTLGNVIASYLIELDKIMYPSAFLDACSLLLRVFIIGLPSGYILYRYWKTTRGYENKKRSLLDTKNKIMERIDSIPASTDNIIEEEKVVDG